jgi:hypothetical protein
MFSSWRVTEVDREGDVLDVAPAARAEINQLLWSGLPLIALALEIASGIPSLAAVLADMVHPKCWLGVKRLGAFGTLERVRINLLRWCRRRTVGTPPPPRLFHCLGLSFTRGSDPHSTPDVFSLLFT